MFMLCNICLMMQICVAFLYVAFFTLTLCCFACLKQLIGLIARQERDRQGCQAESVNRRRREEQEKEEEKDAMYIT